MEIITQNEQPLFRNLTVLTVSKCEEYARLSERKISKIIRRLIGVVLIIVGAVGLVRDLMLEVQSYRFYLIGFAGLIILAFSEQLYKTWGEKLYKRMLEMNCGQVVQINSSFFPEYFAVQDQDGTEKVFSYEDVVGIKERPGVFLMTVKGNIHVLLDKKGFVSESAIEPLEYLRTKVPSQKETAV